MANGTYSLSFTGQEIDSLLEKINSYPTKEGITSYINSIINSAVEEAQAAAEDAAERADGSAQDASDFAQDAAASAAQASTVLSGSVRFDTAQSLTYTQKEQARENINAAATDGYYEGLTSGNAEQLLSSIAVTDKAPYLFRHAGGNNDIGNRETVKAVTGGSVAWNQLNKNDANTKEHNGVTFETDANGITTISGTPTARAYSYSEKSTVMDAIAGHVFLSLIQVVSGTVPSGMWFGGSYYSSMSPQTWQGQWSSSKLNTVFKIPDGCVAISRTLYDITAATVTALDGGSVNFKLRSQLFDLTQMFGSTIADYIYSLEQANAGAGVAWLKSYGYFTQDYYPYTEPVMKHVTGLVSHDIVGFNQWDEEWELGSIDNSTGQNVANNSVIRSKNYISVLPNTAYYFKSPNTIGLRLYDSDKNYINSTVQTNLVYTIPSDVHFIRFIVLNTTTYNHDICINLSHSGYRNGEYEPYVKHSYALDSTVTLRGRLELDSSNNLHYNGDRYLPDGTVERRYGEYTFTGTEGWVASSTANRFSVQLSNAVLPNAASPASVANALQNIVSSKYGRFVYKNEDKVAYAYSAQNVLVVVVNDSSINTVDEIKAALAGSTLLYELATPTEETAAPYSEIQICDDFGTEEYVVTPDSDGFQMPVGHETDYMQNLRDKLQRLPNLPDADGTYLVQYSNRQCSFVQYIAPTGSVRFDTAQSLTDAQKAQARENIDSASVGDVNDLKSAFTANLIHDTAHGSIANFPDGAALPVRDLSVGIEPVQDLHGYDSPWPSGGGKNLDPYDNLNHSARLWGTNNNNQKAVLQSLPVGTYTMSCKFKVLTNPDSEANVQYGVLARYSDGGGGYVQIIPYQLTTAPATVGAVYEWHKSFTLTESLAEQSTLSIYFYCASGGQATTTANAYDIQIEKGDIANPTFAPYSNLCPITGWTAAKVTRTGRNLCGDVAVPTWSGSTNRVVNPIYLKAGTYTISFSGRSSVTAIYVRKGNSITLVGDYFAVKYNTNSLTFTADEDGYYYFQFYRINTTVTWEEEPITHAWLELGSTASTYEPYQGETYTIDWTDEAGTVYGGTLDVTTGKLTVERAMVDLGTLTWSKVENSNYRTFNARLTGVLYNGSVPTIISEIYKSECNGTALASDDKYIWCDSTNHIAIKDTSKASMTATEFKASMSGVLLVYKLITPVVYDLTPTEVTTLLGTNNVWADTGDTTVDYYADPTLYINRKIAAAVAAMS